MDYRTLGSTGIKVSELCLGTWRFGKETNGVVETDRERAHELLTAAWERGINFIDTANVYGDPNGTSEEFIGDWLQDYAREDFVLASKAYFPFDETNPNGRGLSRKHIRAQIEGTLERLGTDYLDVYYIHRWDDETPIRETLRTLTELVRDGKINYLGASSMAAWKLTKALWQSDVEGLERFEVTQPRFNPTFRDEVADYLDVCADQDLAVCPYSPLESGFLTGKYDRDGSTPDGSRGDLLAWDNHFSEQQWRVLEAVQSVAGELDATPAQVTLRWLLARNRFTCIPIIGARTVDQLDDNTRVSDVSLSDYHVEQIDRAYHGE
ncbi:aldo/keto reductase [Halorussus salinisoli]|uniref:aldo/keto reductase n=1 Tax=Halorussus salinisoli TaxID=2558242 RepID=UPI0010C246A6|nr:aldo/keto reductase [Halorussus salinisoli]